jgi:hypothetical protein
MIVDFREPQIVTNADCCSDPNVMCEECASQTLNRKHSGPQGPQTLMIANVPPDDEFEANEGYTRKHLHPYGLPIANEGRKRKRRSIHSMTRQRHLEPPR